jgi:hypothetical protein
VPVGERVCWTKIKILEITKWNQKNLANQEMVGDD